MKYLKLFSFMLVAVLMTACGSDDEKTSYNTANGVTVSMEQDQIKFRESSGIVKVPVVVTGESNGYVTVVCEVKEYNENPEGEPAMDDVHYLLTSKTLTIDAGDTSGYFEIKTVDDYEINPSRFFTITLVDVKGATLGAPTTTIVELRDNDAEPYDRLAGKWYIPCKDWGGSDQTLEVEFEPYEDGTLGYGHSYNLKGLFNEKSEADLTFEYNDATKEGSVSLKVNRQAIFTYEDKNVQLYGIDDSKSSLMTGTLKFVWNEEFTELTLENYPEGFNIVALWDGYIFDAAMNVTSMVRKSK